MTRKASLLAAAWLGLCLASSLSQAQQKLAQPAPLEPLQVTELDLSAIAQTYPGKSVSPRGAIFAPDGQMLSIGVANIVSGDTDQYWIAELASGRMFPATPKRDRSPSGAADGFNLLGQPVWGDAKTFYALGRRGAGDPVAFVASPGGVSEKQEIPSDVNARLVAKPVARTVAGEEREDEIRFGSLAIWSTFLGHGTMALRLQDGRKPPRTLTKGAAAGAMSLDRPRSRLFFSSDEGVQILDLKTMKSRRIAGTLARDQVQDISPDGSTLILGRNVSCDIKSLPPGQPPTPPLRDRLCLLRLPAG